MAVRVRRVQINDRFINTPSNDDVRWFGLVPAKSKRPIHDGKFDQSDRSHYEVQSAVSFVLSDQVVESAILLIENQYRKGAYAVGIRDCVSLACDFAESCGLKVPQRPNFLPSKFVKRLAEFNSSLVSGKLGLAN